MKIFVFNACLCVSIWPDRPIFLAPVYLYVKTNTPSAGYSKGVIRGAGEGPEEGGGRGNRGSKTGRQQKQVRKGYLNVVTYFFPANKGVYYIPV